MRPILLLLGASVLPLVAGFPWLARDFDPSDIKRGLQAMSEDPELVQLIRDLREKDKAKLAAWKAAGKRDIAEALLDGTIDNRASNETLIYGPDDGVLANVLSLLPSSIEGSSYFPEADHPFEPPGPTDQRGPCPGLNTLANHGYLPRNGIVTVAQSINASSHVFNMGADLGAVLSAAAVIFNGDIPTLTFSIGGADARTNSLGILGGLLGTEDGLDGHTHVSEGDSSATRCDFYKCNGDNHNMQPELFAQMLAIAEENGGQFTVAGQAQHFHNRYNDSRTTNPNFYFVPPSPLIVIGATYFYPGFFTNGTIGAGGSASISSIGPFTGAHFNENGSITYVPEHIPEIGWYNRAIPMTLVEAVAGILATYLYPEPVEFGGNAGSTSAFVPGPGLLPQNASSVNGLGCFLYNALWSDIASEISNVLFDIEGVLNTIVGLLDPANSDFLNCTPAIPIQTGPNAYGGASAYQQATSNLPGAPPMAPCAGIDPGILCQTDTNSYAQTTGVVGNRFEFNGVVSAGANPLPSGVSN